MRQQLSCMSHPNPGPTSTKKLPVCCAGQLDEWVEAHEAAEEAAKRQRESAMAEEGWTVVVHAKVRAAGCSLAAAHMYLQLCGIANTPPSTAGSASGQHTHMCWRLTACS